MSDNLDVTIYYEYCPLRVQQVIAFRSSVFVREVDELTVFKYPLTLSRDLSRLKVEKKLLNIVGLHPRIIRLKHFLEIGIYLEYTMNRTLANYLLQLDNLPTST